MVLRWLRLWTNLYRFDQIGFHSAQPPIHSLASIQCFHSAIHSLAYTLRPRLLITILYVVANANELIRNSSKTCLTCFLTYLLIHFFHRRAWFWIVLCFLSSENYQRSYLAECTRSRPITEVKQHGPSKYLDGWPPGNTGYFWVWFSLYKRHSPIQNRRLVKRPERFTTPLLLEKPR